MAEVEADVSRTPHGFEIDEDLKFQRKEWFAQRIGMGLLFLFVLGAALGLTGMGGPLSRGEAGRPEEPVFVEFERFVRRGAAATIRLHLRSAPGDVRFWVAAPYFEHTRLVRIVPEPQSVSVEPGRHTYTIHSESTEMTITLDVEHQAYGWIDATLGLVGGPSVRIGQLAFF